MNQPRLSWPLVGVFAVAAAILWWNLYQEWHPCENYEWRSVDVLGGRGGDIPETRTYKVCK